ncbi:uncharacterized protein LOC110844172 isoform X1 [Folsomia candida]|uniref:Uncharacterized protein n=2 Tax=Folsomia candida TaxID=158441 RepID=A0A226EV32_FOLCA|nr:uncharacterized protein LOC110844172 isoform X1 [Folsomia candida]XP_021945999.1 uncharacterized protein LOC110844172 isoform X1 [Folsomia candida]OXA61027.1 hypothetical protein Fcan01_06022 [Folsomia candida]
METNLKNGGLEIDEPEAVVLLGMGTGESHKDLMSSSTPDFIDELEEIIGSTDKLFVRESQPAIPDAISSFDVASVYEVLDGRGERAFLLGQCREKGPVMSFAIVTNTGHGVLQFTRRGIFNQNCDIEGAGILRFTSVKHLYGGYTLQDKWKKLLRIKTSWVHFCTCCLFSPSKTATLEFINLDGSPSGTITYKKWINLGFDDRTLCVHFIPNLDRKAKYMMFAASLIPFTAYLVEPGRSKSSVLLAIFYAFVLFVIISIIVGVIHT